MGKTLHLLLPRKATRPRAVDPAGLADRAAAKAEEAVKAAREERLQFRQDPSDVFPTASPISADIGKAMAAGSSPSKPPTLASRSE